MNISGNISRFLGSRGRNPTGQEASFDYCFHYFQSFRQGNKIHEIATATNIECSCLQLGFFLASWGMYRKGFLRKMSSEHFQRLIENLAVFNRAIWDIDVDGYDDDANLSLLLDCGDMIAKSLREEKAIDDTLKTKIMLGVFGNVPAFDEYFPGGLGLAKYATFCRTNLRKIFQFYSANKTEIDNQKIYALDFQTGRPTYILYPRAKIIDMIGYVEGGGPVG